MKLIIDIDEDYFKIINKNGASNYPEEVIKNGTPLPKRHGRLIDADALKMDIRSNYGYEEYEKSEFCDELDDALTIVEADKAKSKEQTE